MEFIWGYINSIKLEIIEQSIFLYYLECHLYPLLNLYAYTCICVYFWTISFIPLVCLVITFHYILIKM